MYLVDTNIWLERLLEQKRSEEAGRFLGQTSTDQLLGKTPDLDSWSTIGAEYVERDAG